MSCRLIMACVGAYDRCDVSTCAGAYPPHVAKELLAWQGQLRSTALNGRSAGGPVGKDAQDGDGSSQPPR